MVFKGRFFSSKKSDASSPEGSSGSQRSFGSSGKSPIRSDKKKTKSVSPSVSKDGSSPGFSGGRTPTVAARSLLKKKDSSLGIWTGGSPSSPSNLKKSEEPTPSPAPLPQAPAAASLSPIVASSLGLNKIKTRSGPLPQESFFNFGNREKGTALGVSNLSKTFSTTAVTAAATASNRNGVMEIGKKKKKGSPLPENPENGSNSDTTMSTESGHSRDQSPHVFQPQPQTRLQNAESSSSGGPVKFEPSWGAATILTEPGAFTPEMKTSTYECDNPKESESPRFQAILRVTSAPRKRFPGDIKSFSHELNSKGVRPYPFWKPRRLNNLEEILAMIRAKFDKAKEEVDSDLHIFAADLVGILEKNGETHPEWEETIEDLLVLARSCAMTSPGEFWLQCEGIVQELDDRRQELPMGMLKQLHTRILFILTRCTRLLQFHKESGLAEDEHLFPLRQSLQPEDRQQASYAAERTEKRSSDSKDVNIASTRKFYSQEQPPVIPGSSGKTFLTPGTTNLSSSSEGRNKIASWKKFPSRSGKALKEAPSVKEEHNDNFMDSRVLDSRRGLDDAELATKDSHGPSHAPKHQHKVSWGYWGDQPNLSEESSIICRICEEEVATWHVEDHSRICAIADRCDQKGLNVNERLIRIATTLEKLMESVSPKESDYAIGSSPYRDKVSNSNMAEELDLVSPKHGSWSRRGSEDMLDSLADSNNVAVTDDLKALPSMSCRTRFGPKSDQGMATSSAGSMTPRSPLLTPRMSPIDLLLPGKGASSEHGDLPQMNELADIARCAANAPVDDDDQSLQYLLTCLEDLKNAIEHRKFESLTVDTFGARIEKLIREKYLQLCELLDDEKVDLSSTVFDDDPPLEDDVLRSLRNSPTHSSRDRTSIDDFAIMKPISRGAFGRVFLAQKRTTGDLFAIKVLRKADMIRKNAVESILAERDILISVRNPFVVRFFYSFTCRENLYLVMEYLNGGDLYSLLRNLGCLDEDVARVYIAELVLALEYLHSLRVVHRDLKPDNLLIAHDGHIKVRFF
ncbi:hypothetical protein M569_09463, partial [Genlisea aurea]